MDQKRRQGQSPSQQSEESTRGLGSQRERNRGEGISNRGMDRELEEQSELPERGSRQSDMDADRDSER